MTLATKSPLHWIDIHNHHQTQWAIEYLEKKGLFSSRGINSLSELISISPPPIEIQLIAKNMRAAWYATDRRNKLDRVKVCNWEISEDSYSRLQKLSDASSIKKTIESLIDQAYYQRKAELEDIKKEKRKLRSREDKLKQRSQELDARETGITNALDRAPLKSREIAQQAFMHLAQHLWTSIYENISTSLNTETEVSPSLEDQKTLSERYKEQREEILNPLRLLAESSTFLKKTINNKNFAKRMTD